VEVLVSNGKVPFKQNRQNLLLAGLLALTSPVFGQTTSFVIECNVSGHFLGTTDSKITNQLVRLSVGGNEAEASATIEGSGYLNIGIVKEKPAIFNKEQILLLENTKTIVNRLSNISINRITGFTSIFVMTTSSTLNLPEITNVSGFCSQISNKPKF